MSDKIVFETFKKFDSCQQRQLEQLEPSCFNGMVRVKKYRVTIEPVDEPDSAVIERIQKMWDECKNHHHREPLKAAAKEYGIELEWKSSYA